MLGFAKHVTAVERLRVVTSDADDDKILECAVAPGSEIVVTGDAHLLSLGDFSGIRIQRVAEFLAEFQAVFQLADRSDTAAHRLDANGRPDRYRVFKNAISAAFSLRARFNPNGCPLTARFVTLNPLKPVGT